jgi:hypothetical protein
MFAAMSSPFSMGSVSPGALLGTTGSTDLVRSINDSLGCGSPLMAAARDIWQESTAYFVENVLRPIQRGREEVMQRVNVLMNPDVIRPLITNIDFTAIPPCMYEPIIMYAPLRHLLEEGRINGFGFDPAFLPSEDVYGRLIDNGTCDHEPDENGKKWMTWTWRSTDPKVSEAELDYIEMTRMSITRLLETTKFDPTDMPEHRG